MAASGMITQLSRNWWVIFLRGVFVILFGILAFTWPPIDVESMLLFRGAYVLVDGFFILTAALANRVGKNRRGVVVEGLGGISWAS